MFSLKLQKSFAKLCVFTNLSDKIQDTQLN